MDSLFFRLPLLFCLIVFTYLFLHNFIKKHKAVHHKIPIPPGRTGWPLIGETLDYISKFRNGALEEFVADRRKMFSSKVFKTSLIGQPMAVLCGPEGNKFLFSNERKLVQVWYPSSIDKIYPKSHNKSNKEYVSKMRKMLPSFIKADALRTYVGIMDEIMKQHLATEWDLHENVVVYLVVKKYTFTLACRIFLSIDDPERVEKFSKLIEDIEAGIPTVPINLPGTALNRAIKASKVMRNEVETMVKQRRIDLSEKRASPTQDILSRMLLTVDENGQFLNEWDISSHVMGLLQGGYSTMNGTLTFIMKYLAEHPDVYNEVLKEQLEIANLKLSKELLNIEDLRKMKYSWNVVSEVLRLMPPAPGAFREALTDFTYAGYTIPKGWKLHWFTHATHKDPDYFPNPEKFDPSRFEGHGPAPYTYVPFGGGPRMCPGLEYARLGILVFMHNMVTRFRWEKQIPNEKISVMPAPSPSHGLPVRLHPHNF